MPTNVPPELANVETKPIEGVDAADFKAAVGRQISLTRYVIRPSSWVRGWGTAFFVGGAAGSAASIAMMFHGGGDCFSLVLCCIFGSGGALLLFLPRRLELDRSSDRFIVRRAWFTRLHRVSDIVALQLIHGGVQKGCEDREYTTWQLNAVLKTPDEPRVNLTNHADLPATRMLAAELAGFLSVPILDQVDQTSQSLVIQVDRERFKNTDAVE